MSLGKSALVKIENFITVENFPNLNPDWLNFLKLEARKMVQTNAALNIADKKKTSFNNYPTTYREIATIVKKQVATEFSENSEEEILAETKRRFIKLIKANPKAITFTGHPTEVLSSTGVRARDQLRDVISKNWAALNSDTTVLLPQSVQDKLTVMADAIIKHPPSRKSMGQEQRDIKRGSEKCFDAVFIEYEAVQDALSFIGADDDIDNEDLFLILLYAWPLDNDGKPELTPEEMKAAKELYQSAILAKYVKELATLNTLLENPSEKDIANKLAFKIINSIRCENPEHQKREISNIKYWARNILAIEKVTKPIAANMLVALKLFKDAAPTLANIAHADAPLAFENYADEDVESLKAHTAQVRVIHRHKLQEQIPSLSESEPLHFTNKEKLVYEFEELRDRVKNSESPEEAKKFISKLTQAVKCFGLSAVKAEYRQSIEVYQLAYLRLQTVLKKQKLLPKGTNVSAPQKFAEYISDLKSLNPDQFSKIKIAVVAELERIKNENWFAECREKLGKEDIPEKYRPEYYFADLVEKLNFASANPQFVPVILGAECNDEQGAVLMAIIYALSAENTKAENLIMPLIEYKNAVYRHEKITSNLLKNPAFMNLVGGHFNGPMVAGSDSAKTMSSSNSEFSTKVYYIGKGSGLHRGAVTDAPKTTVQGIEMGHTSPRQIAYDVQLTRTAKMAKALNIEFRTKLTDAEVVTNISNRMKLKPPANPRESARKRVENYASKYATFELSYFYKWFTQPEVETAYSYAARPDKRPSYKYNGITENPETHLDTERTIFGVRAIGHGQRGRTKFGSLILMGDVADEFNPNEFGILDESGLKAAVKKYRNGSSCQHIVNSCIDDIALVHAETSGWETVSIVLAKESGKKVNIKRRFNEDGSVTLLINNLELSYTRLLEPKDYNERNKLGKAMSYLISNPEISAEITMAIVGAVIHDWEHIKSTRTITQVLAKMAKTTVDPINVAPDVLLNNLTKINPQHGEILKYNREISDEATASMIISENKSGAHACLRHLFESVPVTYSHSPVVQLISRAV